MKNFIKIFSICVFSISLLIVSIFLINPHINTHSQAFAQSSNTYSYGMDMNRDLSGVKSVSNADDFITSINNNETFYLANDITLSSSQVFRDAYQIYSGTIYGCGHTLQYSTQFTSGSNAGYEVSGSGLSYGAIVSTLTGAIYDLNVVFTDGDLTIYAEGNNAIFIGGIVGKIEGGTISNCTITMPGTNNRRLAVTKYSTSGMGGDKWVGIGAIAGYMSSAGGTVTNCSVQMNINLVAGVATNTNMSNISIQNSTNSSASNFVAVIEKCSPTIQNIQISGNGTLTAGIETSLGTLLELSGSPTLYNYVNKFSGTFKTDSGNRGRTAGFFLNSGSNIVNIINHYQTSSAFATFTTSPTHSSTFNAGTQTFYFEAGKPYDQCLSIVYDLAEKDGIGAHKTYKIKSISGNYEKTGTIIDESSSDYNTVLFSDLPCGDNVSSYWYFNGNFSYNIDYEEKAVAISQENKLPAVNKYQHSYVSSEYQPIADSVAVSQNGGIVDGVQTVTFSEIISSSENLQKNYHLIEDISIIGFNGATFSGILDGCGYTIYISSRNNNNTSSTIGGLFGTLADGGTIKNLRIAFLNSLTITTNATSSYNYTAIGGVVGTIANGSCIENIYVQMLSNIYIQNQTNPSATNTSLGILSGRLICDSTDITEDDIVSINNITIDFNSTLTVNGAYVWLSTLIGRTNVVDYSNCYQLSNIIINGNGTLAGKNSNDPKHVSLITCFTSPQNSSNKCLSLNGLIYNFTGTVVDNYSSFSLFVINRANNDTSTSLEAFVEYDNIYSYDNVIIPTNIGNHNYDFDTYLNFTKTANISNTIDGIEQISIMPYFDSITQNLVLVATSSTWDIDNHTIIALRNIANKTSLSINDDNNKVVFVDKNLAVENSLIELEVVPIVLTPIERYSLTYNAQGQTISQTLTLLTYDTTSSSWITQSLNNTSDYTTTYSVNPTTANSSLTYDGKPLTAGEYNVALSLLIDAYFYTESNQTLSKNINTSLTINPAQINYIQQDNYKFTFNYGNVAIIKDNNKYLTDTFEYMDLFDCDIFDTVENIDVNFTTEIAEYQSSTGKLLSTSENLKVNTYQLIVTLNDPNYTNNDIQKIYLLEITPINLEYEIIIKDEYSSLTYSDESVTIDNTQFNITTGSIIPNDIVQAVLNIHFTNNSSTIVNQQVNSLLDAGNYKLSIDLFGEDIDNYTITNDVFRWENNSLIQNNTITVNIATNEWIADYSRSGWQYSEEPSQETLPQAKFGDVIIKYYTDAELENQYTEAFNSSTPTGTYYVYYEVPESENWTKLVCSSIKSFTINKKVITITLTENQLVTQYGKYLSYKQLIANFIIDESIPTEDIEYTCNVEDYINVGNYTITASIKESSNYTSSPISYQYIINKRDVVVSLSAINTTYNNASYSKGNVSLTLKDTDGQTDIQDITLGSYELLFKLNTEEDFSTTAPINAGSYVVTINTTSFENADNINITSVKNAEFEINKLEVEFTWDFVEDATITYGDSLEKVKALVTTPTTLDTIYHTTTYEVTATIDGQPYTSTTPANEIVNFAVSVSFDEDVANNYIVTISNPANISIIINKKAVTISTNQSQLITQYGKYLTYEELIANFIIDENVPDEDIEYTCNVKNYINVGNYTISANIKESSNYTSSPVSYEYVINKRDVAVLLSAINTTYNNTIYSEDNITLTIKDTGDQTTIEDISLGSYELLFKLTTDDEFSTTAPINAGSYVVTINTTSFGNSKNINISSVNNAEFKINKLEVTFTWDFVEDATITYGDSLEKVKALVTTPTTIDTIYHETTYEVTATVDDQPYTSTTSANQIINFAVNVAFDEDVMNNYIIVVSNPAITYLIINQKAITITLSKEQLITQYGKYLSYEQLIANFIVDESIPTEDIEYTCNVEDYINVGNYTITASIKESSNYTSSPVSYQYIINKRDVVVSLSAININYNNQSYSKDNVTLSIKDTDGQTDIEDIALGSYELLYKLTSEEDFSTTAPTNVGSYVVTINTTSFENADNINIISVNNAEFEINKLEVEFTWDFVEDATITYGDSLEKVKALITTPTTIDTIYHTTTYEVTATIDGQPYTSTTSANEIVNFAVSVLFDEAVANNYIVTISSPAITTLTINQYQVNWDNFQDTININYGIVQNINDVANLDEFILPTPLTTNDISLSCNNDDIKNVGDYLITISVVNSNFVNNSKQFTLNIIPLQIFGMVNVAQTTYSGSNIAYQFDIDNIDDVIENDLQTIIFDYEITYFINDNEDEIVDNIKNAGKYVVKVKIDESVTNYFMNDYQQEIIIYAKEVNLKDNIDKIIVFGNEEYSKEQISSTIQYSDIIEGFYTNDDSAKYTINIESPAYNTIIINGQEIEYLAANSNGYQLSVTLSKNYTFEQNNNTFLLIVEQKPIEIIFDDSVIDNTLQITQGTELDILSLVKDFYSDSEIDLDNLTYNINVTPHADIDNIKNWDAGTYQVEVSLTHPSLKATNNTFTMVINKDEEITPPSPPEDNTPSSPEPKNNTLLFVIIGVSILLVAVAVAVTIIVIKKKKNKTSQVRTEDSKLKKNKTSQVRTEDSKLKKNKTSQIKKHRTKVYKL